MDEDSPFVQELYAFRKLYNALLFNEWGRQGLFQVHKSKKHSDGTKCFGGDMFIVAAMLPTGQISQHYYVEDWDLFQIPETKSAIFPYDGHIPRDVIKRIRQFISTNSKDTSNDL